MITNDNKPLFLQIKAWIEDHILRDEWQSGSQLPSVRELSAEFEVNPNTIARTYERLTLDGTVRSAKGVGFFVAEEAKSAIIKQRKEEFYNEQMHQGKELAKFVGVGIGMVDIHQVQLALMERKRFVDMTGNNVNHPNDFMVRVYAQTVSAALIENFGGAK